MDKYKAIFMGKRYRKLYYFDKYRLSWGCVYPEFYDRDQPFDFKIFLEKEINYPLIGVGEKVYIKEINKTVTIIEKIRNLDGSHIYKTDYIIETIKDEETRSSYEKAKQKEKEYLLQQKEKQIEQPQVVAVKDHKKWYQFW